MAWRKIPGEQFDPDDMGLVQQQFSYNPQLNSGHRLMVTTLVDVALFQRDRRQPPGLERPFRAHLYRTTEWRNARALYQAIDRKHRRTRNFTLSRTAFKCRIEMMRSNHANHHAQLEHSGGFITLIPEFDLMTRALLQVGFGDGKLPGFRTGALSAWAFVMYGREHLRHSRQDSAGCGKPCGVGWIHM